MAPIRITNGSGISLEELWGTTPKALRGISIETLPNFAMLFGPNSGLSHNSIVIVLEAQSRYLTKFIMATMEARRRGLTLTFEPKKQALDAWWEDCQGKLKQTSYMDRACTSWWRNPEGIVTNQFWGTAVDYQNDLSVVKWSEYGVDGTGADMVRGRKDTYIGRVVEEPQISDKTLAGLVSGSIVFGGAALWLLSKR